MKIKTSFNTLSSGDREAASKMLAKLGPIWQASVFLPIIFWIGFTGIDFLNLKGFFPFAAAYSHWFYFAVCVVYVLVLSKKLYRIQNKGKDPTAWDLNRSNAASEFSRHITGENAFTVIDGLDIFSIFAFCAFPCMFLVLAFFFLFKGKFDLLACIAVLVPLGGMLLQILNAKNVVRYSKEVNKFVEPATKRLRIYVLACVVFIVLSIGLAFFFAL